MSPRIRKLVGMVAILIFLLLYVSAAVAIADRLPKHPAVSLIYFLLGVGEVSDWHRVDAAEVWHWHAGAPLVITVSPNGHDAEAHHLGPDLTARQKPQFARAGQLIFLDNLRPRDIRRHQIGRELNPVERQAKRIG